MNIPLHDAQQYASATDRGHFRFCGPTGHVAAAGAPIPLQQGTAQTLEQRLSDAFADSDDDALIGGAMPFHRSDRDCLWLSRSCNRGMWNTERDQACAVAERIWAEPGIADYAAAVSDALQIMEQDTGRADALRKIVLARVLKVRTRHPISLDALLSRLAIDPGTTAFRVALPDDGPHPRALVGATPELLLEKQGKHILSYPLAGSARRSPDMVKDCNACSDLAQSDKDRREHAIVVEYILDTLAPYCEQLSCPDGTRLTCTRSMWHLGTRIIGHVKDRDVPSAVLAASLHPTPAVCGLPCQRADDLIRQLEPTSRGFYAGAVGWTAKNGDGAWHVAIRCAEISDCDATLFAGAGIVPGSDPKAEAQETGSKFAALLHALGLPADTALTGLN
ncbi:isochorismate synthase [Paracoccus sp. Z330]|uniref:isochorismate synthase n=1 Tax=Paracoccus onchidii TaxID=3017813 RepID=A0ABT4ZAJ6_9RHOB|nr:isochorismate synthase [Paracoccus onchidii]MDB6176380.1 isochorismate synthase [Paracoccus onchidii]